MDGRSRIRTLFVDRDPEARSLPLSVLERRGHAITAARTAEDALGLWLEEPFSLVVTAWELPGMGGLELCERIRRQPGGDRVVVLVASGPREAAELSRALSSGVSDFLDYSLPLAHLETRLAVAEVRVDQRARRHRAEVALRRQEEDLREVIEAIPDGVLVHRGGRLVYTNPAMAVTLGLTDPRELVGAELIELIVPEERAVAAAWFSGAPDEAPTIDLRLRDRDEQIVIIEATPARRVRFDGDRGWLVVCRDVTRQRQVRARLEVTERMASVGLLAAGVAHGINNPLAYMIGNLSCARDDLEALRGALGEEHPEAGRLDDLLEMNAETRSGAERVRVLVRDLKVFSALRDDAFEPVDLDDLMETTLQLAGNELRHCAVVERRYGRPPPVSGNRGHLSQVALNLLINAGRAMEVGRTAENRIVVSTSFEPPGMVVLTIEDTGCGMPPDVVDRVFDPFFTTRSMTEGVGMGLAVCHGLVVGMGGRIELDSQIGRGTRISVILPAAPVDQWPLFPIKPGQLAPEPAGAAPVTEDRKKAEEGLRVLVVDDEPAIGRLLARELADHRVVVVESGKQAMDICRSERFDVVFCDLMMPEISGMDFYDQLKLSRPDDERRIVFMTGGAFTHRAKAFLSQVENRCLEKPFDNQQLQDILRQMMSQPMTQGL